MNNTTITISGVTMSSAAASNVQETGISVRDDLDRLRAGLAANALFAECRAGAEDDRIEGWREYVLALCRLVELPTAILYPDEPEPEPEQEQE